MVRGLTERACLVYKHSLQEQLLPTTQEQFVTNDAFSSILEHLADSELWVRGQETPQSSILLRACS